MPAGQYLVRLMGNEKQLIAKNYAAIIAANAIVARSANSGAAIVAFFAPLRLCVKLILSGIGRCILLPKMRRLKY